MGWDIQINPTAEANHVSPALIEVLDRFVQDFELRYCWVEPEPALIAALQNFVPQGVDEAWVVSRLLGEFARGESVELLIGH